MELSFGEKALLTMRKKKITMTTLAKEMGISISYVSNIINSDTTRLRKKGKIQRDKIAEYLGMCEEGVTDESAIG